MFISLYLHLCSISLPYIPYTYTFHSCFFKGGQVFIFAPRTSDEANDWKSDGHIWSCEGVRKLKVGDYIVRKRHFHLLIGYNGSKRITDKAFTKHIYQIEDDTTLLIHYMGDHTKSKPRPHGNSNKT